MAPVTACRRLAWREQWYCSVHGRGRQVFQFADAEIGFLMHPQQNRGTDSEFAVADLADDGRLYLQYATQFCVVFKVHLFDEGIEQFVGDKAGWFQSTGSIHGFDQFQLLLPDVHFAPPLLKTWIGGVSRLVRTCTFSY